MHLREPFPLRTYIGLSLLGLGSGFIGALTGATLASNAHRVAVTIPVIDPAPQAELVPVASASTVRDERQPAPSNKPGFVIDVDNATWMILDVDPTSIDTHRAPHLAAGEYASDTVALLRDRDLTSELRGWRGQDVIVDGTCTDTLHDFALITQVTGDPVYADDTTHPHWTTKTIEANGTHFVAAKLSHCTGKYARAASAPAAVPFLEVAEPELEQRAIAALKQSPTGLAVRAQIAAQYSGESKINFDEATQVETKVARDPRTGATWIAVHAHADFMCGGPEINFFGLYRAAEGQLVTVREIQSPDLAGVDALVDLDGDGVPELLGNGWITPNRAFYNQDLAPIVSYEIPFFGCPC